MRAKYLILDRHKNDRIDQKYYHIWLSDSKQVDTWLKYFFYLNRIEFNPGNMCWIIRPKKRRKHAPTGK